MGAFNTGFLVMSALALMIKIWPFSLLIEPHLVTIFTSFCVSLNCLNIDGNNNSCCTSIFK